MGIDYIIMELHLENSHFSYEFDSKCIAYFQITLWWVALSWTLMVQDCNVANTNY